MKLAVVIILIVLNNAFALNILAIYPYQGKSHFLVFRVFLRELVNRGHNVTVISHFPDEVLYKNSYHINLGGGNIIFEGDTQPPEPASWTKILATALYLANSGRDDCEVLMANKEVQNLIRSQTKFDVAVVEQFTSDCALAVAYKLGAPVVGTTSHVLMPFHFARFGIPNNPAYVPFHFLGGGTHPTLFQRIERLLFDTLFNVLYSVGVQRHNQNVLTKYFDDIPPLEELGREIKFLLLYHSIALTGSKLLPANVIEVGGYHVTQPNPLTGELKKFVDEADHGVIYISFGSVLKASSLPPETINAILEAVKEFPHRVIWKFEDNSFAIDKNKIYTNKWLPQVDILGHVKTVAFISHAGMGGTTEAIHFGVPVLAMPVLGDQPSNAAAIEETGLGIQLSWTDLTKDSLVASLKVILDPRFREQAARLSRAWHDRPLPPLATAVFWTELAARHPKLRVRTAAADTPFYQRAHLDIAALFLGIILTILYIANLCLKRKNPSIVATKKPAKRRKRD